MPTGLLFKEMQPKPVVLELRGIIPPSFKNQKMLITKSAHGKPLDRPLMITKPEYQRIMARMVDSFVSQLLCAIQTNAGETLTGLSLRSAIACAVPEDDCWTQVPDQHIRGELCEPGHEGVTITIERLN